MADKLYPATLLADTPAGRLAQVQWLLAPEDEGGIPHPEWAVITPEQARELLDMPEPGEP